jgi:hypothetical protein
MGAFPCAQITSDEVFQGRDFRSQAGAKRSFDFGRELGILFAALETIPPKTRAREKVESRIGLAALQSIA